MREIRQSGSEGGESNLPYPYSAQGEAGVAAKPWVPAAPTIRP